MTYQEQIAHPKWQKKRLEILHRDNFTCTLCGDTETTLHIHHEQYGKMAWEVEDKYLHTRCAHCHLLEEYYKKIHNSPTDLIIKVKKKMGIADHLILYVHRIRDDKHKLLDIFSIYLNENTDRLILETIFCEKDLDSFFDFINSIKNG